jgi:hypothetical protein
LVQPLGGAFSGGQSFLFKKKLNVHLFFNAYLFFWVERKILLQIEILNSLYDIDHVV